MKIKYNTIQLTYVTEKMIKLQFKRYTYVAIIHSSKQQIATYVVICSKINTKLGLFNFLVPTIIATYSMVVAI